METSTAILILIVGTLLNFLLGFIIIREGVKAGIKELNQKIDHLINLKSFEIKGQGAERIDIISAKFKGI